MEPTNTSRAESAAQALNTFASITNGGVSTADMAFGDHADTVADLLCNLLHYAADQGFDPDALFARAKMNFDIEQEEAQD